ncbi:hypothetical protein [uncultured Bifidobacterium sp.]|uniref:hypothetical protein n=1 Tax=uncultured Bifidobacterium sp. TaxID=165187 RepID=UPI0025930712|nr:hypothetical protein [uncultured Bifidobacterium sp.]
MAATGNELVKLSQLKMLDDANMALVDTKLNKPTGGNGTDGQVLVTDGNGGTRWEDQHQIDTGNIADGAITETKIEDGAVTTNKIADDAVTADKLADDINVSVFTNDAGYQTSSEVQGAISTAISSVYRYKGTVANQEALPKSDQTVGDVYNVTDTGMNYAWDGTKWDALGSVTTLETLGVTASATELNYVKGVTSGIQEQINAVNGKIDGLTFGNGLQKSGTNVTVKAADATITVGADGIKANTASDEDFKTFMGIAEV